MPILKNLCAEMARNGVTVHDIHTTIGKSERATRGKVNGETAFTFPEAVKVRNKWFPQLSLEYLFDTENNQIVQ